MGEIHVDNDNAVEIVELGIQLEATEDKIIVLVDEFKSGFECKTCGGSGKQSSLITAGALRDCDDCKGKGSLLVIPEISKSLPTLGTVMSCGPKTQWGLHRLEEENNILIRNGAKVLFSPHVGTFVPIKGNIRLKIMREHEPLAVIYGVDYDAKNFIDYDVPIDNRY